MVTTVAGPRSSLSTYDMSSEHLSAGLALRNLLSELLFLAGAGTCDADF